MGFFRSGDGQVVGISVSRIAGLMAMAILFSAAALEKFHKAALDHFPGELQEPFLETFALFHYSRLP